MACAGKEEEEEEEEDEDEEKKEEEEKSLDRPYFSFGVGGVLGSKPLPLFLSLSLT